MIVKYTAQDQKKLKQLEKGYDQKIVEAEELIKKLEPGTEESILGSDRAKAIQKKRRSLPMPEPVATTDDGDPVYPKEALEAYYTEKKKLSDELDRIFKEYLASGSQGWRDARKKLVRLKAEKIDALNSFSAQVEKREFLKLGGDHDKIIQSAKEQIALMIDNRFESYRKMIETHQKADGKEISGFSGYDLRVDGTQIYLDSTALINDARNELLKLHFEALSDDQEATKKIDDLIFSIITSSPKVSSDKGILGATFSFKKKRKPQSKKNLPTYSEADDSEHFYFSTTQMKNIIYDLMSNNGDIKETAKKINAISKRNEAQIFTGENSRALVVETENTKTIIEILSSASQKINNRAAKKILHFIENEIYQHIYYKGKLNDEIISFPLQKMIDKKLYSSVQNARRAFYEASNVLTALRVSGVFKAGKGEISTSEGNARIGLFPTMRVKGGQCLVRLSKDINWSPILKDFFLMPDSWYALPDNAFDLEYKIFRSVRLNKRKIDQNGKLTFNISLRSVAIWLNLPPNTKNPKRDVKKPIEEAVNQVRDTLDPNNFKIEIKTDPDAKLDDYLNGYLKIIIGGVYTKNLIGLNEKQQARIERTAKKKDEIITEASVRKLTEQMKNDDKNGDKICQPL